MADDGDKRLGVLSLADFPDAREFLDGKKEGVELPEFVEREFDAYLNGLAGLPTSWRQVDAETR